MTRESSKKPLACLSLDLDNQWSYMKTHGDAGWESFPSYLDVLAPRVLSALAQWNLKITFFVVGQDAALERNHEALQSLAAGGHELGNHSFHHEPWIAQRSKSEIDDEIHRAHDAIGQATGLAPVGFRGPGFAWSESLFETLVKLGYRFDASTLPTYLGPLARLYYFRSAKLSSQEKTERAELFGNLHDGFRPVKPYSWRLGMGATLLEIPVSTIPIFKIPFHLSYLIYLSRISRFLMMSYLKSALLLCRMTNTEPSFLLHPLDFLGADDAPALKFFPGMDLSGQRKLELFHSVMAILTARFNVVKMSAYAEAILSRGSLKELSPCIEHSS